ncbi:MAG: hypothetical protein CL526_06945 [Aequorivita sp.]|nr:hypothetical protein [Aequorivita sp.]|tara:strand:+ start:116888 stop:117364 length:477 start_codon:yes stop_codon:yes gene_type:complete
MKKISLILAFLSLAVIGCNNKNEAETANKNTEVELGVDKKNNQINNNWLSEIQLDNGSKWIANAETTDGVVQMLSIVKSTKTTTVADFHDLAAQLNDVKNYIVKECTMKGPSHDNLHIFLYPLIEKINALGAISAVDEGTKIKRAIQENLTAYYNYFE